MTAPTNNFQFYEYASMADFRNCSSLSCGRKILSEAIKSGSYNLVVATVGANLRCQARVIFSAILRVLILCKQSWKLVAIDFTKGASVDGLK